MKRSYIIFLIPFLLLLTLLSAVVRVGWVMPVPVVAAEHGFLMVSGLFGTLIGLERTLILRSFYWLAIPLFSAIAVILVLSDLRIYGFVSQLLAALLLALLYFRQWLRYREVFLLVLVLSAFAWMMSAVVLLAGNSFPAATIWYILFLLFTIAAERLELSKFIGMPSWARPVLLTLFSLLIVVQTLPFHWGSNYLSGLLLTGVGYWLIQFDIIKVSLRKKGFFLYVGSTLFAGYIWLMVSGVLMLMPLKSFYHYDAVLHTFFIGFAFSMLYAHAPIIFPALLKISERPFHRVLYLPVALTHGLLILRLYADYSSDWTLRKWIGLFQVLVMLSFFVGFAFLMVQNEITKRMKQNEIN